MMRTSHRLGRRLRKAWAQLEADGFSASDLERIKPAHTVWWATRRALGFHMSSEALARVGVAMNRWRDETLTQFARGEITYQRAMDITRMIESARLN